MSLREGPQSQWLARGRVFFDTNILVYTDDRRYPDKQARAVELVRQCRRNGTAVISTQVLQEYYAAVTRKLDLASDIARGKVEFFSQFPVFLLEPLAILSAIDLHRLHQLSIWDGLILHAALASNCKTLLTEDMAHGATIRGIRIVNPFADLD
ncbi:MAG: PIN domain-containing protein [Alphaproteobacteria bacterium]